jgi:hypothetical protein
VHAHHVEHWVDGGATALANLALLCTYHHTFVHERGWTLALDRRGTPTFRRPDGTVHAQPPPPLPSHLYRRLGALPAETDPP